MALEYVHTCFENGSPVQWEVEPDGIVRIGLLYDHERASPNRAAGHWHVQLQAPAGTELTVVLENFDNIWNGKPGSPVSERTSCFVSPDGRAWSSLPAPIIAGNRLEVRVRMESDSLYLARLEPYRLSDLHRLLAEIRDHPLVEITPIGRTVEGRELEIIRVGHPEAPYRILLRARAHPWEPGGNWVVQGLIRSLLEGDAIARRCLDRYSLCVMPMAAKDGVVRGHTRFNVLGMDLNRNWERPADPELAPENHALERWLEAMIRQGKRPHLAIDLHNDNSGRLHPSRPATHPEPHRATMKRLEQLLLEHTWFTEGTRDPGSPEPWTFGEGLVERYGIDACILELNCDWIAGLKKVPFGKDWELLGQQMRELFFAYCENQPGR
jgi:Zinc carboxypeptidase